MTSVMTHDRVDELLGHLPDADLAATVWSGVTPNPKDHEILAGFESYRDPAATS